MQPNRRATARSVGLYAATAGLAALVFLVVRGGLIDDAYITLSYARNVAEHLHWGLTAGRTANSATSPLNVLVLAAGAFVVRDGVWGLGLVFVLLTVAQLAGLRRLARTLRLPAWSAPAATAALLLNPLMLSIVGMEMTLALTLIVWATAAAAEGRAAAFGALSGLLVLTRIDLVVLAVVLWVTNRALLRRTLPVLLAGFAVVTPWFLVSWYALGALVPDTLVIKTIRSAAWGTWNFANGWRLYLETYPGPVILAAVPALVGLLAVVGWLATLAWRRPRFAGLGILAALGLGAAAHYLAYTLLAPPPYHWYFAPSVGTLTLVGVLAAGAAAPRTSRAVASGAPEVPLPRRRRPTVGTAVALAVTGALLAADAVLVLSRLSWEFAPITTNWASAEQYTRIGEELRPLVGDAVVRSPGEIGTLAYACRCDIVDLFADRATIPPLVAEREKEAGAVFRHLLSINFAHLETGPPAVPDVALSWVPAGTGTWSASSPWRGPGAFILGQP